MNNDITTFDQLNSENILEFLNNYDQFLRLILENSDYDNFPFQQEPTMKKFNLWLKGDNKEVQEDCSLKKFTFSDNEKSIFLELFTRNREVIKYDYWGGGRDRISYKIWLLPKYNKNVHISGSYDSWEGTEYEFDTTQLTPKQVTIWN